MNRGESDNFTSDSNKINIPEIRKQPTDPEINSDTFIGFVKKLPI